jgi:excisionase family DNA binding protein
MSGIVITPPEPIAYSRRDAAKALGICERVLFGLVAAGKIREIRIGRSVRIPRSELLQYVADLLELSEIDSTDTESNNT